MPFEGSNRSRPGLVPTRHPNDPQSREGSKFGAPRETRTPDPLITNQMLYRLSYRGDAFSETAFSPEFQ